MNGEIDLILFVLLFVFLKFSVFVVIDFNVFIFFLLLIL